MCRLRLYTTLGCHLCEQVEAELVRLGRDDIQLERVEIAEDDALLARYGVRIPVLRDEQGAELERGFESERLAAWLEARGLLVSGHETQKTPDRTSQPGAQIIKGRRFLK